MGVITAILTAVLCVLAYLTWRVYKRMEWLSGALESHSMVNLRITAADRQIPCVWWDPDQGQSPAAAQMKHGELANVQTIYVYVPPKQRATWKTATRWKRFRMWLNAEI